MNVVDTGISGLVVIEPRVFVDNRRYFFESYSDMKYLEHVCKTSFVQDNESRSTFGVLRGFHFQKPHEFID